MNFRIKPLILNDEDIINPTIDIGVLVCKYEAVFRQIRKTSAPY